MNREFPQYGLDSAQHRYQQDPKFHALVDMMHAHIRRADYTPSEMRDAAVLASIHYESTIMRPIFIREHDWKAPS